MLSKFSKHKLQHSYIPMFCHTYRSESGSGELEKAGFELFFQVGDIKVRVFQLTCTGNGGCALCNQISLSVISVSESSTNKQHDD